MLPPMSVPHPTTVPCRASSVPSPPVDPPAVNSVFFGCTVRPNRGFSVSHHYQTMSMEPMCKKQKKLFTMMLCGRFDLAMITAPICFKSVTRTQSCSAGLNARPTYPSVLSYPLTSNWSFKVMGTPCKGPTRRPCFSKKASSSLACCSASAKMISVRLTNLVMMHQS